MTGINEFEKLKLYIDDIIQNGDPVKFYEKNNKSAGVRLRKNMQIIKEMAQNVRDDISKIRKDF